MNTEKLDRLVSAYKAHFNENIANELYKWQAVKCFQENWNIDAEDFASMLFKSLMEKKKFNLLDSGNNFSRGMINALAQFNPEEVRAAFRILFSEEEALTDRINGFSSKIKEIHEKYQEQDPKAKNHYQSYNAISVYLWLRYPDKYYVFKPTIAQKVFDELEVGGKLRGKGADAIIMCYEVYDKIAARLKQDENVRELLNRVMTSDCYNDVEMRTVVVDFAFYIGVYRSYEQAITLSNNDKKRVWVYAPGENARKWDECLENSEMYLGWDEMGNLSQYASREDMVLKMKSIYGESSNYTNSSLATWEFVNKLKVGDIVYAKRGSSTFLGRGVVTGDYVYDDDRDEYYNVRSVKWDIVGEWNVDFKIVLKTLTDITDIENYPEELENLIKNTNTQQLKVEGMNYWWLNGNPKVWSINNWVVGEEQDYTLYNSNGNKRRIYKNFVDAKVGDIVICYEANPTKQIVGIAKVSKAAGGDKIYFKKTETLISPIDFKVIKDIPELQGMEFLINPNGSFFKLTSEEYETIISLIREANDRSHKKEEIEAYTKADFLGEVFMKDNDEYDEYERLSNLLLRKKNIILQGAPGVGKTFAAKRLAYSLVGEKREDRVCCIQFHQNYTYEDFIMGYKPEDDKFVLRKGVFYDFCILAKNNPNDMYFLIIDEINRGNLSKIFGELLMLIENDHRGESLKLAYNGEEFCVPKNLYIIGMMNTADRSLAMIDYALRRRFSFFEMKPGFDSDGFKKLMKEANNEIFGKLIDQIKSLNEEIEKDDSLGPGFEIGHSYFCYKDVDEVTEEWIKAIVDYDIIPTLHEYWFDDKLKINNWSEKLRGVFVNGNE